MDAVSELVLDISESGGRIRLGDLGRDAAFAAQQPPFSVTRDRHGQQWVELHADGLKLCGNHCTKEGCSGRCGSLHLCKFFLLSVCRRPKCKFGHDITSAHNRCVLRHCGFGSNISEDAVKAMIKRNRTEETLPAACKFYNNEGGCDNTTAGSNACVFLHVCRHFLAGDCKFGPNCKRSHNLVGSGHSKSILEQYGITGDTNEELLRSLRVGKAASLQPTSSSRRRTSSSSSSSFSNSGSVELPSPPARSLTFTQTSPKTACPVSPWATAPIPAATDRLPEICTYNLVGKCNYGQKCRNHHSKLPYQWQLEKYGSQWEDCQSDLNLLLEESFCKPNMATEVTIRFQVSFSSMTIMQSGSSLRLRRLETVSTAVSETRPFATEWLWLWVDVDNKWIPYGQEPRQHFEAQLECVCRGGLGV